MNQTSDLEVRREAHSVGDTVVRDDIIQEAGDSRRWSEDLEQHFGAHAHLGGRKKN